MVGDRRVDPPRIRTLDEAIDYLPAWVEIIGGVQRDGLIVGQLPGGGAVIESFHVVFPGPETVLTVAMTLRMDLSPVRYKFDLRCGDGTLLWRHDRHPGHEAAHGGPSHLHIGPEAGHRIPAAEATLDNIATRVVSTHINLP